MNNVYKKQISATEMTDAMFRYYKAKAPKNEQQSLKHSMVGQTSPASAETHEPSTIAAIATNGAADAIRINTASKNLQGDEMVPVRNTKDLSMLRLKENPIFNNTTSFHPRIKFTNKLASVNDSAEDAGENMQNNASIAAIPTSVVVTASPQIDIKPIVDVVSGLTKNTSTPTTVIKSTPDPEAGTSDLMPANAIAAALINRNYHSFQKQLRAQDILRHQQSRKQLKTANNAAHDFKNDDVRVKALDTFLERQRNIKYLDENEDMNAIENNDGDDEDDSRYNTFDDIHLLETSATQTKNNNSDSNNKSGYLSDESQKLFMAANAFRNLEYTLSDYLLPGSDSSNANPNGTASLSENGESIYECRHCGKKYRWKSTLRRHENVECGGKEPSHQCPYCPYKSKQRGNLGVHVRKHHSDLPQLASKRRSKYSMKSEKDNSSNYNTGSDDSSSKLVIDYPK
ncbi:longitudinals lacking protein [Teleopsis dalmanni]|uniref:longitudinals lacking protein n=1 Tax=Teleopsis dalmanni TaxID=139649 RepID=UPI0018CCCECA|nr:longitudinals lacking protein [Teleopsis dalmanni]